MKLDNSVLFTDVRGDKNLLPLRPCGEQMYVIARMEDALTAPLVPESELKRRLKLILALVKLASIESYEEVFDILLHRGG
jgi:uncharacterized protein (DUF2237 family)